MLPFRLKLLLALIIFIVINVMQAHAQNFDYNYNINSKYFIIGDSCKKIIPPAVFKDLQRDLDHWFITLEDQFPQAKYSQDTSWSNHKEVLKKAETWKIRFYCFPFKDDNTRAEAILSDASIWKINFFYFPYEHPNSPKQSTQEKKNKLKEDYASTYNHDFYNKQKTLELFHEVYHILAGGHTENFIDFSSICTAAFYGHDNYFINNPIKFRDYFTKICAIGGRKERYSAEYIRKVVFQGSDDYIREYNSLTITAGIPKVSLISHFYTYACPSKKRNCVIKQIEPWMTAEIFSASPNQEKNENQWMEAFEIFFMNHRPGLVRNLSNNKNKDNDLWFELCALLIKGMPMPQLNWFIESLLELKSTKLPFTKVNEAPAVFLNSSDENVWKEMKVHFYKIPETQDMLSAQFETNQNQEPVLVGTLGYKQNNVKLSSGDYRIEIWDGEEFLRSYTKKY